MILTRNLPRLLPLGKPIMQMIGAFTSVTLKIFPMRPPCPSLFLVLTLALLFGLLDTSSAAVRRNAPPSQNSSTKNTATRTSSSVSQPGKSGAGKKPAPKKSRSRRARGQKAPTPDRIRDIQSALAREGVYKGQPSGKWDAASIEAMKRFQTAQGLPVTGKLDARSLQKLGLGSEVAGQAAPRDPASPSGPTSSQNAPPSPPSAAGPSRENPPPSRPPAPKSAASDPAPPPPHKF